MTHFKKWQAKYQKRGQMVLPMYSEQQQKEILYPIENTDKVKEVFSEFSAMISLQAKLYKKVKSLEVDSGAKKLPSVDSKKLMEQYLKLNQEIDLVEQKLISVMKAQLEVVPQVQLLN